MSRQMYKVCHTPDTVRDQNNKIVKLGARLTYWQVIWDHGNGPEGETFDTLKMAKQKFPDAHKNPPICNCDEKRKACLNNQ